MYYSALSGFALGGSLIIAIGAQNAFILRMGLLRQHVFILCLICALADALLIVIGVAGLGVFVGKYPQLLKIITLGGFLFLITYAALAAKRAVFPHALKASSDKDMPLMQAISICLAFTFLNPHVYLDTVVLVGGLAARWHGIERIAFTLGAVAASFVWFFALGYGARLLQPVFERKIAWRVLDGLIAVIMAWLAISLLLNFLS
ncbi:MAG: amino acid transporter [Rhizobiaceae bacterium]|nr:amino acid transporter [Rhizobiaceae bacterium]